MKIEKIKFNNHKIFDNLEIDFKNKEGNVLNTIVIIGENGSGKTTLLKCIYDSFSIDKLNYDYISENKIELKSTLYTTIVDKNSMFKGCDNLENIDYIPLETLL